MSRYARDITNDCGAFSNSGLIIREIDSSTVMCSGQTPLALNSIAVGISASDESEAYLQKGLSGCRRTGLPQRHRHAPYSDPATRSARLRRTSSPAGVHQYIGIYQHTGEYEYVGIYINILTYTDTYLHIDIRAYVTSYTGVHQSVDILHQHATTGAQHYIDIHHFIHTGHVGRTEGISSGIRTTRDDENNRG